jgi:alanyl-tRNA synthetase
MNSQEIRARFLDFFKNLPKKEHAILPSASLVTSDKKNTTDSTLFNTAGMQPLIPYLLGEKHPEGERLASVQKCLRTVDIDDIGDNTHATFFEMLGNWSLGDYWKKEAIEWSFEFLTSKEKGLGLDPRRLYVTVFEGDENAPRDDVSHEIWKEIFARAGVNGERIYFMGAKSNWWSAGDNGPCGPDTEMFYDLTGGMVNGMTKEEYMRADQEQKVVEIWNDVFMEYEKRDGKVVGKLPQRNVDTGAGLERLCMMMQGVSSIFETDLFTDLMGLTSQLSNDVKAQRIIADHIRTSVFLISDSVTPSNTDRGYVLRKLLRRSVFYTNKKDISPEEVRVLVQTVANKYKENYPDINHKTGIIEQVINDEVMKFKKTLVSGMKKVSDELGSLSQEKGVERLLKSENAFVWITTDGLPLDLILMIAKDYNFEPEEGFDEKLKKLIENHQSLSRAGAEQKFKGGLADDSEISLRYHTTTHLLHQALYDVLGNHVEQKGSNITAERLRFDFSHTQKMTDEEKKRVEDIVNEKIKANLPVQSTKLPIKEALNTGARHLFNEKYNDEVNIYFIGDTLDTAYSKEFCGGPHVENTNVLGHFKITKEEAVSAGVRRIKAILE